MREIAETVRIAIQVEEAIWEEVRRGEQRRTPMFEFVRELKASPHFSELTAESALHLVRQALAFLGYGGLAGNFPEYDDPEVTFLVAWETVIAPDTFGHAVKLAKRNPVELETGDVEGKHFGEFVSLCYYLQRLCGDVPIFIPVEKFGEVLGVSGKTITIYRRQAQKRGMLKLVSAANFQANRAAKYRVTGKFRYRSNRF